MKNTILFCFSLLLHAGIFAQIQPLWEETGLLLKHDVPLKSSLKKVSGKDSVDLVTSQLKEIKAQISKNPSPNFETDSSAKWNLLYFENFGWNTVFTPKYERVEYDYKYINIDPRQTFTTQQIHKMFRPENPVSPNYSWLISEVGEKYMVVEAKYYNHPCNLPNSISEKIYYFGKAE